MTDNCDIEIKRPIIVFSDFDGTISQPDSLQFLLENFGDSRWEEIEAQARANVMSEREVLAAEFATLKVEGEIAFQALRDNITLDSGFAGFVRWLESEGIPLIVLSGGIEEISRPVLEATGLGHIELRANRVRITDKKWEIIPSSRPRIKNLCHHCKTSSVLEAKESGYFVIYIGDGLTDRCPAGEADLVFARGNLADYCRSNGMNFLDFRNFSEVQQKIQTLLNGKIPEIKSNA